MPDVPKTPEEMRDLFAGCSQVVREYGKDSIPMSALAISFGLVWHALTEEEAVEFFDDLASFYGGDSESGAVRMPTEPTPRRRRRFRRWF